MNTIINETTRRLTFTERRSTTARSDAELKAIHDNPVFGKHFTDHLVAIDFRMGEDGVGRWQDARLEPYGPITLDPAAAVFHYGQEIFEGLKAYRHDDGSVWTFRPEKNAARFNRSAARLALPELPPELFLEALRRLVAVDKKWVPTGDGESLYLRPFMIATETYLGVRPAHEVAYRLIASPAGNYFGGTVKPVSIWLSRNFSRAGVGGTGTAKCGGNYAASLAAQIEAQAHGCQQVVFVDSARGDAVEELGGMNIFFVHADGRMVTPALSGTILEGVTRSSILQLGRDRGLDVQERTITLNEWRDGIRSGAITEVFACGTAAVLTPIGKLVAENETIGAPDAKAGQITMSLREELLGIQTGKIEDRHGWLSRLA